MGLRHLNDIGVSDLLDEATGVLERRGLAKGLRVNPQDGSVDLVAALAIACGVRQEHLMSSVGLWDFPIPPANQAKFYAAIDVLDALQAEPDAWADDPRVSVRDVQNLFSKAAIRLRSAVT